MMNQKSLVKGVSPGDGGDSDNDGVREHDFAINGQKLHTRYGSMRRVSLTSRAVQVDTWSPWNRFLLVP